MSIGAKQEPETGFRRVHSDETDSNDLSRAGAGRSKSQNGRTKRAGAPSGLRTVSSASCLNGRSVTTLQMDLSRQHTSREWLAVADKGIFTSGLSSITERTESESSGPRLQARLAPNVTRTFDYFAVHVPLQRINEEAESDKE
ncbi:hypothetical protein FVE85_2930 [Porphyridium purpureum]|uniref:Uncharacterized protein n=1 Tax=Porphyridium purpureum TaxID=35688 RepID=A0A5J4YT92_PORPP|nr:hypothetical protein FVE85_2930 [Porphyridium purpureum]|eukprot:POR3469..scf227_4